MKKSSKTLQNKIWKLCKEIIRKKYGNECYTCVAKNLSGGNWQTGHMLPKSTLCAFLKYDLRLLRPQCSNCNIWNGGMGAEFLRKMIIREGQDYVDKIFEDRKKYPRSIPNRDAIDFYETLIPKYEQILEDLD